MSNFDINVDRQTDERNSGLLCRKVKANFDINVDRQTDERNSGLLCRKVRRSGRCFTQGLMVV